LLIKKESEKNDDNRTDGNKRTERENAGGDYPAADPDHRGVGMCGSEDL
jgi:hypothetical protein